MHQCRHQSLLDRYLLRSCARQTSRGSSSLFNLLPWQQILQMACNTSSRDHSIAGLDPGVIRLFLISEMRTGHNIASSRGQRVNFQRLKWVNEGSILRLGVSIRVNSQPVAREHSRITATAHHSAFPEVWLCKMIDRITLDHGHGILQIQSKTSLHHLAGYMEDSQAGGNYRVSQAQVTSGITTIDHCLANLASQVSQLQRRRIHVIHRLAYQSMSFVLRPIQPKTINARGRRVPRAARFQLRPTKKNEEEFHAVDSIKAEIVDRLENQALQLLFHLPMLVVPKHVHLNMLHGTVLHHLSILL